MTKLWISGLLTLLVFAACQRDIMDVEITPENYSKVLTELEKRDDLTEDEREAVDDFLGRLALSVAFLGEEAENPLPEGTTVRGIVENYREEKAKEEQAELALREQRQKLLDVVSVKLVDKRVADGDWMGSYILELQYENTSTRDIRGFKGVLVFYDMFDDRVGRIAVKEDLALRSSDVRLETSSYLGFSDDLEKAPFESLSTEWRPEMILFVDGDTLTADWD